MRNLPKTDNCCNNMGWLEFEIEIGGYCLHLSVAPDTDLDDTFTAFCHDVQEIITVNGWLIDYAEEIK